MQKLQLQPGAIGLRRDPCPDGQGPLREGSGTYIVRSSSLLGFEAPVWLWWRNAPIGMIRRVNKHPDAHHDRQNAGPVSIAEASTYVVRCPHPGTQIMNEPFNIPAMLISDPAHVPRAPNKTGEDNVIALQAEAFIFPTLQSKGTLSPTQNTTCPPEVEAARIFLVNDQLESVDPPIDAVGDDSD